MICLDRVHPLLEHRAMLLGASAGLLRAAVAASRLMTPAEQDSWNWAVWKITQLEDAYDALIAEMAERHYYPIDVPRPDGYEIWMG